MQKDNEVKVVGELEKGFKQVYQVLSPEGLSPTLDCCGGGNRQVKILEKTKKEDEGIILAGCMDNSQDHTFESANRVYDLKGISPTLNTCGGGNLQVKIYDEYEYRIRRLTPKEYGRLMGVSDEDYEKMAEVNSNSQLYKQFGNSIVVDVMVAIFKNLNINQHEE